jgi:hypothetical protein
MFDFNKFSKNITLIKNQNDFSLYLESCFMEVEDFFQNISNEDIQNIKFNIEDLLYDLLDNKLIQSKNSKIINAFLILLAEKVIQTSLIGSIMIISDYVDDASTRIRLDAAKRYLKINDVSKDYFNRLDEILVSLDNSAKIDEYNTKAIKSFLYFIKSALFQFQRVQNNSLFEMLISLIFEKKNQLNFLQDVVLNDFFGNLKKLSLEKSLILIDEIFNLLNLKKSVCSLDNLLITKENSEYSSVLYNLKNPTFDEIRNISYSYIKSIGDRLELYERLQRGEKIIDDERLLYKYLVSFGGKHKAKLYGAYDAIIEKLKTEKFDIIDWGCGQATATMLLLNYANERNIKLDIENITLIEPSSLALSRGLLHIDILKQKDYQVNFINSDLDCLNTSDFKVCSKNKILHIFSNILDIESFSLDLNFFSKVSKLLNKDSIFICVSPNRNDKLNNRLDLFYNYFDENFDTELISSRNTDIDNSTRYEKIFEVKLQIAEIIEEKRYEIEVIQNNYKIDTIKELALYSNYVEPILDLKILENSINTDSDYAIFKIRKVAEIITTQIYSKYEDNEQIISFNDKIRYLAYEQKVFTKASTNYVQTLRTIGNRGVHGNEIDISKLRLDAHLMVIALISFIKEIKDDRLI